MTVVVPPPLPLFMSSDMISSTGVAQKQNGKGC